MIIYALFSLIIVNFSPIWSTAPSYILRMNYPQTLSNLKGTMGYYKGTSYDLTEGWCCIKEDHEVITFSIVIAEEIDWKSEGNNIRYFARKADKPCLWFDITLSLKPDGTYSWLIEERKPHEIPLRLPENTIFIQLHPDLIETVTNQSSESPAPLFSKGCARYLPMIKLKKSVTPELFQKKSEYLLMASFDVKTLHGEQRKIIKSENPVTFSMITVH